MLRIKAALLLLMCLAAIPARAGEPMPEAAFRQHHARYLEMCATCHGADWMGGLGGSLVDGKWRRGGSDAELAHSIKLGSPLAGMPAFGALFSDPEVKELIAYLHEARRRHDADQDTKAETPPDRELAVGGVKFRVETFVAGLEMPWSMAWLPDGRMLVTERPGSVRIVARDGRVSAPVGGTPAVFARNQGGLLDVAVHPSYAENGWIYLSYSHPREIQGKTVAFTAVARGRITDGRWTDHQMIFEAPEKFYSESEKHWGCRLVFDGAGHLFFGIGERGNDPDAQDLAHPAGKIHRLYDDGREPADNPFAARAGTFPSVWAYGVRNPQGLVRDSASGRLWETEHGPRGGDEFNLIEPGRNYGWPVVSRGRNYNFGPVSWAASRPDVAEPLLDWSPSIAASALAFYAGDAFPGWRGSFLAGGLVLEQLDRITVAADGTAQREAILKGLGRVRDVRAGPDGLIYLALNHRSRENAGRIVRLRPIP
jgi:glucose/arabinose dehydrogenase